MASLRVPHSWQPGLQVDNREGCAAEHAGGRAGLCAAPRRQQRCSASFPRRGGRCRAYARNVGIISDVVKACGTCGGSTGVGDHAAESIDEPREKACRLLRVEGGEELQDLIASLILSECVYKKLELDEAGVAAKVAEFVGAFPPGWVQLQTVQLSLSGIPQHYLIATSPTSMYVVFMGTKQFQDILADANLLHTPIWAESARLAADRQSIPAAHRGFLERARAIHVEQLYELAVSRGLRLVLCGHSLGGAVAKLCTLRLLRELPDWPRPRVRCIAFATPAVGNAALAELVESAGWASHFSTYYLPEDQLVRLISFSQARTPSSSSGGGGPIGAIGDRRNSGSGRTERRRRALERAARRGPAGGFSGVAADVTGAQTSPVATTSRLNEATLGGLGSGVAAPVMAVGTGLQPPGPRALLPRVPSASSIASASSCASAATSGAGPRGSGSGSSTCSSRSLLRGCSLGGVSADSDGPTVVQLESPASPAHCMSSLDRASSGCDDGGPPPNVASPPLRLTSAVAAAQAVTGFAVGSASSSSLSSFAESMDEDQAGVALAMEEILAPGLDALEAAAAAGVALSGQPPADMAAAQREALYGNAGGSWGLRLALGRKRVMRRLRRIAAKAHIPLPKALLPVSRYHTFGGQWFVTEEGALSPAELEAALRQQKVLEQQQQQQQQVPQLQQAGTAAAAAAPAVSESSRGFFSFHRMVAYRQRHADLVARIVRGDSAAQGDALHAPADTPQASQSQTVGGRGGGSFAAAPAAARTVAPHCPSVQLSDNLLPRISVQRAVLRGLLPETPPPPTVGRRVTPDATASYVQLHADSATIGGAAGSAHSGTAASAATAVGTVGSMSVDRHAAAGGALVMGRIMSWVRGGGDGGGGGLNRSGGSGRLGGADEPVRLDLELEGCNLQYCRKVSVALLRDGTDVVAGAAAAGIAAAAGAAIGAAPAGASSLTSRLTASAADGEAVAPTAGAKRWAPFGIPRGASSTAGPGSRAAPQQLPPTESVGAAATGLAAAPPSPSSPSQLAAPSTPPSTNAPAVTAAAAVATAPPAPATTTEVPCEVVQVLYAQPYSDEANPPPLHPVSLFRNTLHHFAVNLMRRCRLQGQGRGPFGTEVGSGFAGLAATGVASAACASVEALAGRGDTLAEAHGARGGPWQRFRFQRAFVRSSSDSSGGNATPLGSPSPAATGEDMEARGAWQLPGSILADTAAASRAGTAGGRSGGDAAAASAAAAAVPPHTVVEMPSRLMLRVTLPRSVARGLLDGTLRGRLVVSVRSDFHALSAVPVAVQRPRVAILGTSPYAASLVQAALSAPAALAAAGLDGRAAGGGGVGAGTAVPGVAAWVPQPVAWALAAVRGATAAAVVRRRSAPAVAETGAAAASAQDAGGSHGPGSATVPLGTAPRAASVPGGGSTASSALQAPAAAAASASLAQGTSERFVPWWSQWSTHGSTPRLRARMGRLRWGIRQSLAAAAVGAAAASAAGVTGAAAAVGAAAVVASTVAALSSDGGVSVLANAAVTLAAVVAAAAAAASAFSGSEAALVVAAAASAAAVAFAAATSSGEGALNPPPRHEQQQAAPAKAPAMNEISTSRAGVRDMAANVAAPVLRAPRPAALAVAAASPRRWVLRFGSRPAAAGSGAGGAVRSVGRGWMLWWPGGPPPPHEGGAMAAQPPVLSPTRWLSWPLPNAPDQARGPMTPDPTVPRGAAAAAVAVTAGASAAAAPQVLPGASPRAFAAAALTAPAAATAAAQPLSPPTSPADPRRRPAAGWLPPTGAAQRRLATIMTDAAKAAAATAAAAATRTRPKAELGGGGGSSSGPASAAVSLAQLRSGLLGRLRAGSGLTALPLPPGVLSDGLEIYNVMVEPVRRTWGSGRSGAAAAAAGQHLLPLRPPGRAAAAAVAHAPLAPVPVALLWRGRCQAGGASAEPGAASAPNTAPAVPDLRPSALVAMPPLAPGGLPVPPRIDPRGAAAAACAALNGTATAAAAAAAVAAVTALGLLPARDGCPELVGVAPFVAVHRMEEGLRRQVLQRGIWWRALLGGLVGALLRPVALVGLLGRLPGWALMQALRRGNTPHGDGGTASAAAGAASAVSTTGAHGGSNSLAIGAGGCGGIGIGCGGAPERHPSDWGALLVVASCRDPLRVLRGRGMEALRARAAEAACPVVPVLLTCPESPPGRRGAAARTLAAACGVGPGEVRTVVLDGALLHSPAAAIPRADLGDVWRRTAECEGAAELRAAVQGAVAVAAAQAERQEL